MAFKYFFFRYFSYYRSSSFSMEPRCIRLRVQLVSKASIQHKLVKPKTTFGLPFITVLSSK